MDIGGPPTKESMVCSSVKNAIQPKKEENPVIFNSMDELEGLYVK